MTRNSGGSIEMPEFHRLRSFPAKLLHRTSSLTQVRALASQPHPNRTPISRLEPDERGLFTPATYGMETPYAEGEAWLRVSLMK